MRPSHAVLITLTLAACGSTVADEPDAATDTDIDAATADAAVAPDAPAPACDVGGLAAYAPVPVTAVQVLPSETAQEGETIQDTLQGQLKRHYIVVPTDTTQLRGELFVWLAGSGGEPHHYTSILEIAAAAGYGSVSLAYDNETSLADLCGVPDDPICGLANPDCEEDAREELIYGSELHDSPCVEVARADSIEHRLLRLLQYVAAQAPSSGVDGFLTDAGTAIDWSRIAVGGWSQGGGHAGMLARDHLVARALYVSKGADSTPCPSVVDDPAECDLDGDGQLTPGNDDELLVPSPWTYDARATPGSREFGAIHGYETAWAYSRETFEVFGMGAKADALDIDGLGPYPEAYEAYGCAHVMFTHATPACGPTDFHKSVAVDGCLARDDDDIPLLAPAYYYALTVPVP